MDSSAVRLAFRIPGVSEAFGPAARRVARSALVPAAARDRLAHTLSTHLAIPTYVRSFEARTAAGVTITLSAKPQLSLTALAYYRGLESFEPQSVYQFGRLAVGARGILDVGANAGIYAFTAAAVEPSARIVAVDPLPLASMSIARSVRLGHVGNVRVAPFALSDREGIVPLYTTVSDSLSSLDPTHVPDRVELTAITRTMDQTMAAMDLPPLDLLKVDVEGFETKVLAGGLETLRRDRPAVLFEALDDAPHGELDAYFRALDYVLYRPRGHRLERVGSSAERIVTDELNVIALPAGRDPSRV